MLGKFNCTYSSIKTDDTGKIEIAFSPATESRYAAKQTVQEIKELITDGKDKLTVTVDQYRNKRSLDANSYAWVLISQIADIVKSSKEEIYIEMLKKYGQREPQLLSVVSDAADMVFRATDNHCVVIGESELKGKLFKHLAILIGSSRYDSKEMAILVDGVISEAQELGIETATPDQKARMLTDWSKKHEKQTK